MFEKISDNLKIKKMESARIPTDVGEFWLCLYTNNQDSVEHLALVMGNVAGQEDVLVRVHSECYTGDVLGSTRCDCGEQLRGAMQRVAKAGFGVIIYLRQEGRGIGLLDKLRAYNLQDQGYDTVEANLLLGHQADQRDYSVAALILKDLEISSLQLLTNNPKKLAGLQKMGIVVTARVPLYGKITDENEKYFRTKVERLHHFGPPHPPAGPADFKVMEQVTACFSRVAKLQESRGRPFVTLTYAQSLDGSIAAQPGRRLHLSNSQSHRLTHQLRAAHDAIFVGIGTVLADDPQLTVRLADGKNPQPIIADGQLRCPLNARLLQNKLQPLWIMTSQEAGRDRQAKLEDLGARVFRLNTDRNRKIILPEMLTLLAESGVRRLMVEGGSQIISSFIRDQLADQFVLTVAPMFVGGLNAVNHLELSGPNNIPRLKNIQHHVLGNSLIIRGDPVWGKQ